MKRLTGTRRCSLLNLRVGLPLSSTTREFCMRATIAVICAVFLVMSNAAFAVAPERSKGVSVHMLPKRVADLGQKKWGFVVAYAEYLRPEQSEPVLQTPNDVFAFIRKQDRSVQGNGIWVVTTHPDAYSDQEKKLLDDIKTLSRREKIPLFIVRGSELPNGWRRYDDAP